MKHRPTLYIGIGGTGCSVLLQIQKNFTAEYGEGKIPRHIRFLGIDTDWYPEANQLEKFLQVTYGTTSPKEFYASAKDRDSSKCSWYPNDANLLPSQKVGVASNRANARFLLEMDSYKSMSYIRGTISELSNIAMCEFGAPEIDIRFVISLAGGTGSGLLIPIALMLSQYPNATLYAYSVLRGVFRPYDFAARVITNAFMNSYATVLELDYIQHASVSKPFSMKVCNIDFTITEPLFKEFYVLENTDGVGLMEADPNNLLRMLSLSMYSASFDCEGKSKIKDAIAEGLFNINNKAGWICALGASEIIYNGDKIAEFNAYTQAKALATKLLEDDYEYSVTDVLMLSGIYGIEEPEYWSKLRDEDKEKDIALRLPHVFISLPSLGELLKNLKEHLSVAVLPKIKTDRDCLQEIADSRQQRERDRLYRFIMILKGRDRDAYGLTTLLQDIALKEYVIDKIEKMLAEIQSLENRCKVLTSELRLACLQIDNHINDQLKTLKQIHTLGKFDISYTYWELKQSDDPEVPYGLLNDLLSYEAENSEILDKVLNVTIQSKESQHYRDIIIEDVIESLPESARKGVVRFLRTSANRLLALNSHGLMPRHDVIQNGILTIYSDKQTPCLSNDIQSIFGTVTNSFVNHLSNANLKDRIILSFEYGAVLPYCLKAFTQELIDKNYTAVMEHTGYNPHIDANLYDTLTAQKYTLMPARPELEAPVLEPALTSAPAPTPVPALETNNPKTSQSQEESKKYDVFISSKSEDYKYAEQIYDFLVDQGLSVFLACRELKIIGEAKYALAIDEALDEARHMVVMLSSADYAKSKWVQYEWSTFEIDKRSGYREGNLLIVKFPEVEQKKLPPALRHNETFLFDSFKEGLPYYLK